MNRILFKRILNLKIVMLLILTSSIILACKSGNSLTKLKHSKCFDSDPKITVLNNPYKAEEEKKPTNYKRTILYLFNPDYIAKSI